MDSLLLHVALLTRDSLTHGDSLSQLPPALQGHPHQGRKQQPHPQGQHHHEPAQLDKSLVGASIYMRWEKFGWQLAKITGVIDKSTPRLCKKFNYRLVCSDGSKGPAKLSADYYAHGSNARYNSWVILTHTQS
tara:strand:- start:104 stop:502 length:399 start_codon:yes stop_codon:yes gene_type:complete